jgi:hypothetical protein
MLPALGDTPVAVIRRRDVVKLLEGIAQKVGTPSAYQALKGVRDVRPYIFLYLR